MRGSHFLRVVYPRLIGVGLLVVAIVCVLWACGVLWQACLYMHEMSPAFTCTPAFAVSMAFHQYGLLLAYAVLSAVTGLSLLTRRAWAKRLAVAHLGLSVAYVVVDFCLDVWNLSQSKALLGPTLSGQLETYLWIEAVVVIVVALGLVGLAILMARVPWPRDVGNDPRHRARQGGG